VGVKLQLILLLCLTNLLFVVVVDDDEWVIRFSEHPDTLLAFL